jgi:leucyl-tRNA synthetase
MKYNFSKIEHKWQNQWSKENIYTAKDKAKKPKKYVLVEFPYPSGEGLHMGHLRPYVAGDVYSRFLRMRGHEVMYPMGWDAFGLPAENFAIKKGVQPSISTAQNIKNAKRQIQSWGISFDWSREINTTDPKYYKWTQWIFLQLFKAGLAYEATGFINWCPKDKTGLANEEVIDGKCERCGTEVEQKKMKQWYLRITAYADKLIAGLKDLDWPESVKIQQMNWIGKSEGALIGFDVVDDLNVVNVIDGKHIKGVSLKQAKRSSKRSDQATLATIDIFTTRPDTIFGATYLVLAPESPLITALELKVKNIKDVLKYVRNARKKNDEDRIGDKRAKTGVELKGVKAINPANKKEIPIWVADYVLGNVGTGAIMAVPAHDERDFEFAQKFKLPALMVICPHYPAKTCPVLDSAYIGIGHLVASGRFNGMPSEKAKWEITRFVNGERKSQYKLRDWVFSRQRYWGEPIPIIHCVKCGTAPVPEKDLPVLLPPVKKYEPTGTGESPLAAISKWVNTKCPKCKGPAKRETNTMPQWAGSSWYYLRYPSTHAKSVRLVQAPWDQKLSDYWLPVDIYFGGMEHTTLHLLYSRFWHIFLHDQGLVPTKEPYARRVPHGIILGPDGEKMSKSRGNVVSPDEIIKEFGADALRMYELFLGPHEATVSWDSKGIVGVERFLARLWKLCSSSINPQREIKPESKSGETYRVPDSFKRILHGTVKKVTEDIENLRYNTAISSLMVLLNESEKQSQTIDLPRFLYEDFALLLAPFAPHIAEEIWRNVLGYKSSVHLQKWPTYNPDLLKSETFTLVIQINGKFRDTLEAPTGISEKVAKTTALDREKIKSYLDGKEPKNVIYVPNRLINIVI